jgi:hypothetical protein
MLRTLTVRFVFALFTCVLMLGFALTAHGHPPEFRPLSCAVA